MRKLSEAEVGYCVIVHNLLSTNALRERMLALGLTQGATVEVVRKGPSGDPTVYKIRGAMIALRKEESSLVEIEDFCYKVDEQEQVSSSSMEELEIQLPNQQLSKDKLKELYYIEKNKEDYIISLAGNPNTGKSTVFNALTGLHQHTGNWPGKTVSNTTGSFKHKEEEYLLVDLPGTYSLFPSSVEEEVARDFICFGNSDAVIIVADATCLERNLNLAYQIMELTNRVILCINLMDEAKKRGIEIDKEGLEKELGIPIVLCAARNKSGLEELKDTLSQVLKGTLTPAPNNIVYSDSIEERIEEIQKIILDKSLKINCRWLAIRILDGDFNLLETICNSYDVNTLEHSVKASTIADITEDKVNIRDQIMNTIYTNAKELKDKYVKENISKNLRDKKIDNIITSRIFGFPLMILGLAGIFWITITGANLPSSMLADFLFYLEDKFTIFFKYVNAPPWIHGILVLGLYRTLAWVVSVMLPPMAIFFPLFTILEDLGYLPRVAFNLDHLFKKACAHGKQCLTMCMGLGCNAAGIISCRIIDSPRERMIATLTNNFVPCNGRFPTLIAISTIFFATIGGTKFGILPAFTVSILVIIGIMITLMVSYLLSKTLLKGVPSTFTLELPPYRRPKVGRILYTSIIDRTIFVLWRAVIVAAPAGAVTWILGNIYIGDLSIISHVGNFLNPFATAIGLDGFILMAFILGLPANEIVLPCLLMAYLSTGSMIEFDSLASLKNILVDHGWTHLTALNTMLFSLLHWPCATTLITIKKETGSCKWTFLAAIIPTAIAIVVCFLTTSLFHLFGLN